VVNIRDEMRKKTYLDEDFGFARIPFEQILISTYRHLSLSCQITVVRLNP